jgi:hypothetical protein
MAARKKNTAHANGAHSATDTAVSPLPAPIPPPPAGGPAAAVWAARTAAPGATAAQIAAAAGTTRIAAGRELAALETSGLASRAPGTRTGRGAAPATWQPATRAAAATAPASPGEPPLDIAGGNPAAAASGGSLTAGLAPEETDATGTGGPIPDETAAAPAESAAPAGHPAPDPGTAGDDAGSAGTDGEQPPALATDAAELLREVAGKAAAAGVALDGGDTAAALAGTDAVCAAATRARRLLKAGATGRRPRGLAGPAARPGQLRDLVQAHLGAHPDAEFTPRVIGRDLGRSSGAVANAMDRLTALGYAQLTSDKPRRYRHQATTTPATAGTARRDGARELMPG